MDKITFVDVKVTIALLIRQFGVADNVVQWTPEKLEELKGEYRAQETEENAGDEHEVTRVPDTQDSQDDHGDFKSNVHDDCADEDIENKVWLVTYIDIHLIFYIAPTVITSCSSKITRHALIRLVSGYCRPKTRRRQKSVPVHKRGNYQKSAR